MFLSYEDSIWCSPVISGKVSADLTETFALDLSSIATPLVSLFLIVQLDKGSGSHLSPFAYGIVKFASDIGSITRQLDGEVPLFEFSPAGKLIQPSDFPLDGPARSKQVGNINYHLIIASTMLTNDENVFRLLHLEKYRGEAQQALENFMSPGIREWSKFIPELTLSHLKIIATDESLGRKAFQCLVSMFSELLSTLSPDYSLVLNEFIHSKFVKAGAPPELIAVCSALLPHIVESLSNEQDTPEYRTVLKTIPYLIRVIGNSYSLDPTPEKEAAIRSLFDKLKEIISLIEEDKAKSSVVITNQRLLLQHIGSVVEDLTLIFTPQETVELLSSLISSIRRGNDSIEKAKLQLLYVLTKKNILWASDTSNVLHDLYRVELQNSFSFANATDVKPVPEFIPRRSSLSLQITETVPEDVMTGIFRVLMSLVFANADDFVISFVPMFAGLANDSQIGVLLLCVAFTFPRKFPLDVMLNVAHSPNLSLPMRLFVLLQVIIGQHHNIRKHIADKPYDLLLDVLHLAEQVGKTDPSVDAILDSYIYSINGDFSILAQLFESLTVEQRENYDLVKIILPLHFSFPVRSLSRLYFDIATADFELHQNVHKVKCATLYTLFRLPATPQRAALGCLFEQDDIPELIDLSHSLSRAVLFLTSLETLPSDKRHQDERLEALSGLISLAVESADREMRWKYSRMLVAAHATFGNPAERAFALVDCLQLIPCDDSIVTEKPIPQTQVKYNRELYREVIIEAVQSMIKSGHEEYALPLIEQLIAHCIAPYQNIELMPQVAQLRAQIFKNIASTQRPGFSYFWVTFTGDEFSYFFKDRSFIYRRPADAPPLVNEFREKFPNALIATDPPAADADQSFRINVVAVELSSKAESESDLVVPSFEVPRYIFEFRRRDKANVFRCQVPAENGITECYLFAQGSFPGTLRRLPAGVASRIVKPARAAAIEVGRLNFQLKCELYWYSNPAAGDTQFAVRLEAKLADVMKRYQSGSIANYIGTFFDFEYLKNHRTALSAILCLKDAIVEQRALLADIQWNAVNPPDTGRTSEVIATTVGKLAKTAVETLRLVDGKIEPALSFTREAGEEVAGPTKRRRSGHRSHD